MKKLIQNERNGLLVAGMICLFAGSLGAQNTVRFSVDSASSSVGWPGSDGVAIECGSILGSATRRPRRLGPAAPPITAIHPLAIGLTSAPWEVDAFSHGRDKPIGNYASAGVLWLSVDRNAAGRIPGGPQPTVYSEQPESCSDLFVNISSMALPAWTFSALDHVGTLDGNGRRHPISGHRYPGLGVVEGVWSDDIDGFDQSIGAKGAPARLFFSLDTTSAAAHGYIPGDILMSDPAATIAVFANATDLGLDQFGEGTDDVDALALFDNGQDGIYSQPNSQFDWGVDKGDMLLFSVRQGSAIIGQPCSTTGILIEAGDVLTPPALGSGLNPTIFITAERLGLRTSRTGMAPDDLNAFDIARKPLYDRNGSGVEDSVDIATGYSADANDNGVPDESEPSMPALLASAFKGSVTR